MKICVYSPYVPDHTGGGERYLFDVATTLAKRHEVYVALPQVSPAQLASTAATTRAKYEKFLGYSLQKLLFVSTPLGAGAQASFWQKLWWTRQFDVMYYVTDGSLFFSLAGRNIVHIQVPLVLDKSKRIERLKLLNWSVKNTNSEFTKAVIERSWQTQIDAVHWPMIELNEQASPAVSKQKIILHVGRFFRQLHSKRQDVLVNFFKQLRRSYPTLTKGWKLVLIGAVEDQSYAQEVAVSARRQPIEVHHQVSRGELLKWYQRASIYWHATGYGVNPAHYPEKMEHFGISTVEAMVAGAVPIVINKGGQPEILGAELQTCLWNTESQCLRQTAEVIKNSSLRKGLASQARQRAQHFGRAQFENTLWQMVEG